MLQCHATAHGEEDGTSQSNYLMIGNITKSDRPLTERLLLILIILFFIITFFFVLIPIFFYLFTISFAAVVAVDVFNLIYERFFHFGCTKREQVGAIN